MPARSSLPEELIGLLLHLCIAGIGGTLIVILSGEAISVLLSRVGVRVPDFNPIILLLFFLPVIFLGIVVNRSTRHRSACIVGFLGALFLLLVMRSDVSLYERSAYYGNLTHGHYWWYEFQVLFSPVCPHGECLGKVFFTLPFLTSVAYSIGAWLGLRIVTAKDAPAIQRNP
jgi:hypothetical protein